MIVASSAIRRLAVLLGLSILWLLLCGGPALAHARLLQADPASGERLSKLPEQVRLQFNEPIEAEFTPVKVFDPNGDRVDQDDACVDPEDARVLVSDLGEPPEGSRTGVYKVEWRVTSDDGHPVNDTYGFTVAGSDESQSGAQAGTGAGEAEEQPSDQSGSETGVQQDADGISSHIVHIVGLGIGVIVLLVLMLRQRIKGKS